MIALEKENIFVKPDVIVIKRDGRHVAFDKDKIYQAIVRASNQVTELTPLLKPNYQVLLIVLSLRFMNVLLKILKFMKFKIL